MITLAPVAITVRASIEPIVTATATSATVGDVEATVPTLLTVTVIASVVPANAINAASIALVKAPCCPVKLTVAIDFISLILLTPPVVAEPVIL